MKWILLPYFALIFSCKGNYSAHLSPDQQGLYKLAAEFVSEYKHTSYSTARQQLLSQHEVKLQGYIKEVCKDSLQKMRVQLDRFETNGDSLLAEFTDENCKYFFHQTYATEKEMKGDTIYQMLSSLKKNTEVTIRFLWAGNVKVNSGTDEGAKVFEIAVIPTAIESQAS